MKLRSGDEIRVIAPSRSLSIVRQDVYERALSFWHEQGFRVTFSRHSRELAAFQSSAISSRVEDLHEAFADENVRMIVSCIGGFNTNQMLRHLDFDLIARHPKILCGYSDVTALLNAIHARTGLTTYHGPHFSTFGFDREQAYTWRMLAACLMQDAPVEVTPSRSAQTCHVIQPGTCEGAVVGGNLCTLNLLQGTPCMPDLRDKVLFLEDDNIMGDYFCYEFDRNLESLLQCVGAQEIRGIVFGRFDENCHMTADVMAQIVRGKVPAYIPVIFGADFGHVFPMMTFPIGGKVCVKADEQGAHITLLQH